MSESELLMILSEYKDRMWVLETWQISVAVGLYSLAYIAGRELRVPSVAFILSAYLCYIVSMGLAMGVMDGNCIAVVDSLRELEKSGAETSLLTQRLIVEYSTEPTLLRTITAFGYFTLTVLGAMGYLMYQCYCGQKERSSIGVE